MTDHLKSPKDSKPEKFKTALLPERNLTTCAICQQKAVYYFPICAVCTEVARAQSPAQAEQQPKRYSSDSSYECDVVRGPCSCGAFH